RRLVPAPAGDQCFDRTERVLDVDEVAAALRVAHDHDRLAGERAGRERGDRAGGAFPRDLAGPIDGWKTNDERRRTVQATGLLAEALRMRVWIGRRVERRAQGRRVDEPGTVLGTALEQIQRRAGVLA